MHIRFKPFLGMLALCLGLLILYFSVTQTVEAQGVNVFVSSTGTGTDCYQASPCAVSQGMSNAVAGDTIYFKYGPYTDVLNDPFLTTD